MPKKDAKAKKAEKKLRTAAKAEKKTAQKEKKAKTKGKDADDTDAEDVDLDAVLAEYARQQEQYLKVTEVVCQEPPSARSSATIVGSPANDNELFLFGGEYYNGALAQFFNDLFVYNINRDEWRIVTSPNSPLPRSGHAWTRGGNAGGIHLFGGEFSSPKQGTFYHYNDFWRLEPSTREWTRIEPSGKGAGKLWPPARSGHRMTYFKNYIILFGGFQDTSQQTKYLNDLWIYDCANFAWHTPALPAGAQKPDARSSFSLLPHDSGAVLYGGYSRVKATALGKATKGGGQSSRTVLKPLVHQDTWFLRITPPAPDAPSDALPTVRWEKRKKPANAPSPSRAGATMAHHKGRGIMFGGVHDVEESEEGIDSEFFDQLFAWNIDRNRYFPLVLRKPRQQAKKQPQVERGGGRRGRGKADEEELLANLKQLELRGVAGEETVDVEDVVHAREEDDEKEHKVEKPVQFEMPHPRFNAQLTVQDDVLYVYGGTFEKGDREYTFDEMWAIDLGKLDGVKQVFKREVEDWQGSEDEDDDESDEDEDDESDEETRSELSTAPSSMSAQDPVSAKARADAEDLPSISEDAQADDDATAADGQSSALGDDRFPHPRPFESRADFYTRTSIQWQDIVMDDLKREYGGENKSVKEVKKLAFDRAEEKWWDCREEIRALEDAQEEAGIGDVVSLADKAQAGGGAARRR